MQRNFENYHLITSTAKISTPTHGGRAKCLQRLVRLDLPVPKTVALSFDVIKEMLKMIGKAQRLERGVLVGKFGAMAWR